MEDNFVRQVHVMGFYRHFKNKYYQVKGTCIHSETKEKMVLYQALYGTYELYVRPFSMFMSEVDHVKYPDVKQKYRFEEVDVKEVEQARLTRLEEPVEIKNEEPEFKTSSESAAEPKTSADYEDKADFEESVLEHDLDQDESGEGMINPFLLDFLDADSMEDKYNLLNNFRGQLDQKLIDDLAVSLDTEVSEGDLSAQFNQIKKLVATRAHFEGSRLR